MAIRKAAGPPCSRDVLEYFLRNPLAADSLEGIARWRLLEQIAQRTVLETQEALGWLVARGFLTEVSPTGSSHIYRLNPAKRAEAEGFVEAKRAVTRRR